MVCDYDCASGTKALVSVLNLPLNDLILALFGVALINGADAVSRICEETLGEIFPERDNLELTLAPRDATLLADLNPTWIQAYPGIRIRADAALTPGDCQVRSRFGLTDARVQTKMTALQHSLSPT